MNVCAHIFPLAVKKSPEDLIQAGCSSAVQLDPGIAERGLIACRESHHFFGNAMKKAAVKCLWGCSGSSCLPGVLAMAPIALPPLPPGRKMGVPHTWAAPAWGRTAAAGSWHLTFCPSGTWRWAEPSKVDKQLQSEFCNKTCKICSIQKRKLLKNLR